jgi:hypothetical protein
MPQCIAVNSSGKNVGQRCPRNALENAELCAQHSKAKNPGKTVKCAPAAAIESGELEPENTKDLATFDDLEKYMCGSGQATAYFVKETPKFTWFTQVPAVPIGAEVPEPEDVEEPAEIPEPEDVEEPVEIPEPENFEEPVEIPEPEDFEESAEVKPDSSDEPELDEDYTLDSLVLIEHFKAIPPQPEGCLVKLSSGHRSGAYCSLPIKSNHTCGRHKGRAVDQIDIEAFLPKNKWNKGKFWDNLLKDYNWKELSESITTKGRALSETARDNDNIIDPLEEYPKVRHSQCFYSDSELSSADTRFMTICGEEVEDGAHFCKKHRRHEKTVFNSGCIDPRDTLCWVGRPIPEYVNGFYHFERLNLFSIMSINGPVVVGKLWRGYHAEQLTTCPIQRLKTYRKLSEEEIESGEIELDSLGGHKFLSEDEEEKHKKRYKYNNSRTEGEDEASLILRCHNNGLLYKILPQKELMYQHDIGDLDSLPGKGFLSFEQMIRDRPSLYVKYWNVWNEQIKRSREWLAFEDKTAADVYKKTGIVDAVFWPRFKARAREFGLFNVIVPAPSVSEVQREDFNPFKYCEDWVRVNRPEKLDSAHFPPMYILYPFPDKSYQEKYRAARTFSLADIALRNSQSVQHYHYSVKTETPYCWLQWLKYGNSHSLFSGTSFEVPPSLRDRIGFGKFPLKPQN